MRFSLGNLRDFRQHALTLPEIDGHHYQSANVAPTARVRHRIMTDQF